MCGFPSESYSAGIGTPQLLCRDIHHSDRDDTKASNRCRADDQLRSTDGVLLATHIEAEQNQRIPKPGALCSLTIRHPQTTAA